MPSDTAIRTPGTHLRRSLQAAVIHLAATIRRLGGDTDRALDEVVADHLFLGDYLTVAAAPMPDRITWDDAPAWWRDELAAWERGFDALPPLLALGLDADARIALATALLAEEDARFAALFARLGGRRRPSLEALALVVHVGRPPDGAARRLAAALTLVARPLEPADPLPNWELRIASGLVSVLRGDDPPLLPPHLDLASTAELPDLADVVCAPGTRAAAEGAATALDPNVPAVLLVRGTAGADRELLVDAIARSLGRGRLRIDEAPGRTAEELHEAAAVARATRSLPAISIDVPPGERVLLPELPGLTAPLLVAATEAGALRGARGPVLTVHVERLGRDERRVVWREALRGHRVRELDTIASRHRVPDGWIRRAAADAVAISRRDDRRSVTPAHVREALSRLTRGALEELATPLPDHTGWDDLVVGRRAAEQLGDLERWIVHREELAAASRAPTAGVRALFSGPSGTGKTLAARVLAGAVGMDCYRIDLATVVSKYIGETEKNLDRVLSRAEELDVVLLLDEGDALLGTRTDVRSSNDRYANLETNYLLQRLEVFDGVIVVTTNVGKLIDPAFQRRMDVVVDFVPPDPGGRRDIWRLHLPTDHGVKEASLDELADHHVLTGGQIRNAALRSTLRALTDGRVVDADDVRAAVAAELAKAGAIAAPESSRPPRGVTRFVEALR
jgi:hypothetical protein